MQRAVPLGLALASLLVMAGCLAGPGVDDGQNDSSPNQTNGSPTPNASQHSPSNGSVSQEAERGFAAGLPRAGGIGDGAVLDLGDRVVWLNATNETRGTDDGVTVNLTTIEARDGDAARLALVLEEILTRTLRTDHRLEPDPIEGGYNDVDGYATLRRYLADAMLVATANGGTRRQRVDVLVDGRRYRVAVGAPWPGGPTIDPDDPRHAIVAPSLGPNASVVVRYEGRVVLNDTSDLTLQHNEIYTVTQPGNYSVTITTVPGVRYTASFDVPLSSIADCNPSSTNLARNGTRLDATLTSTTKGCMDPADRGTP